MSPHDSVVAGSDIVILSAARTPIGKFQEEIAAVPFAQRKGPPQMFETDENPRRDTCLDVLRTPKTGVQGRWHGDSRQRARHHRRCGCAGRGTRMIRLPHRPALAEGGLEW